MSRLLKDPMQRRRTVRIPSSLAVSWTRRGVAVPAVAADINEHGVFVLTHLPAQRGELLPLKIELPDGTIDALVVARYVGESQSGRGIGAELFMVDDDHHLRWCRYYQAQLRAFMPTAALELGPQSVAG